MSCTITQLPDGVQRSALDFLHPLDLGKLLFCNHELSEVVIDQTHRWKTIGTTGNKRSRNSTIFRRYVRAANTNRVCYACFQRKNGRSQSQCVCSECKDTRALANIHARAWFHIERMFRRLRGQNTFVGHLARIKHDPRRTRNIGRLSKTHCGLCRTTSFAEYVATLGRRILREQLLHLTAQEYRKLPSNLELFRSGPCRLPATWPLSVARKIINRFFRTWDLFDSRLPLFHQNIYPTVRRLIPVEQHTKLQAMVLHAIVLRLRNRTWYDLDHCRTIERKLLLRRLETINASNYSLEVSFKDIGLYIEPMIQRIVQYTTSLVGPNILLMHYPNFRAVVEHNVLFSIFCMSPAYPLTQIRNEWP